MQLIDAITHYHSLLDENGAHDTFVQLDAAIRARAMLVGKPPDRLICSVLRPRLLTEAQLAMGEQAATLVGRAIRKVGALAVEQPAGIGYDEAMVEVFDQLEIMRAFRSTYQATALPHRPGLQQLLLDTYRAWGGDGTPTIAIVDYSAAVTWPEFEYLAARFRESG